MEKISQRLLKNVHLIRERTQRSIHDCASYLNIPKKNFLKFEKGEYFLSLPEIELLAQFLGVTTDTLFIKTLDEKNSRFFLDKELHEGYKNLRQKMIRARILLAQQEQNLSLEELHQITHIPYETLEGYLQTAKAIPTDHLLHLLKALNLPFDLILNDNGLYEIHEGRSKDQTKWQPEYPDEKQPIFEDDPYILLRDALQTLPKRNQAEILKALLTLLRQD